METTDGRQIQDTALHLDKHKFVITLTLEKHCNCLITELARNDCQTILMSYISFAAKAQRIFIK
jgi:hypothetical protein